MFIEPKVGDLYKTDMLIDNGCQLVWTMKRNGDRYVYTPDIARLQPDHALLVVSYLSVVDTGVICLYRGTLVKVPLISLSSPG